MALFSADDKQRIAAAIAAAERDTAGEIVCVVARSAGEYAYVPVIWAALVALALPLPLLRLTSLSAEAVHLVQLAVFVVLAVLLWLQPLRVQLVPGWVRRRRGHRAALEQFHAQGMYRTAERTGCLIYVAEAERYAEVIADEGIAARVSPEVWKSTIEVLTDALGQDRAAAGFIAAVEMCGAVLRDHAPRRPADSNELPNRLILL